MCTSLKAIEIPNSVESLSSGLHVITFDPLNKKYFKKQYGVFSDCQSLEKVVFSNNMSVINNRTFENCSSLKAITIPENITKIEEYAFIDCASLKTVYYTGSEEQWNNISIEQYNDHLTNTTIVYNYKG